MTLNEFVETHDVDCTKNIIQNLMLLGEVERELDIKIGQKTMEYITKYGYLGYKSVELYGINSRQGMKSDMVKQTEYLHKYFPATRGYLAIENQGDGDYYLVDSKDVVFEYDSEKNELSTTNLTLFDYIVSRFQAED